MAQRLILASGSAARRQMLLAAGVAFEVVPSQVDEAAIKTEILGGARTDTDAPIRIASELAAAKALDVGRRHPDALVIGSDQVLSLTCDVESGSAVELFDKPASRDEAREHLIKLRGGRHVLTSAVAMASGGQVVWEQCDAAQMTMRAFSDAYLEDYLAEAGDSVLGSVGCYQLEGRGIQLFETIEGDYFTILGMPLLPLLSELRRRKVIAT